MIGLSRDADHIYTENYPPAPALTLPGVTGVLRALDKPAIPTWVGKVTAEAAVDNRHLLEEWVNVGGREGAVAVLQQTANTARDKAGDIGSQVHALADAIVKGQPVIVADDISPFVNSYVRWIEQFQPEFLAVEEMVAGDGYAGTLDSIAVIAGETWLLDIKTAAKGPFREVALQLAAYGNARYIGREGDPTKYAMPKVDQYGVIKLRPEGAELVPVNVQPDTYEVFRAVLEVSNWFKGPAKSVIEQPIGPALLNFPNVPKEKAS